jgi:hypothetical protein
VLPPFLSSLRSHVGVRGNECKDAAFVKMGWNDTIAAPFVVSRAMSALLSEPVLTDTLRAEVKGAWPAQEPPCRSSGGRDRRTRSAGPTIVGCRAHCVSPECEVSPKRGNTALNGP